MNKIKTLIHLLDEKVGTTANMIAEVTDITRGLTNKLFPDAHLPIPHIKVVSHARAMWLGRTAYRYGTDNSRFEIQKGIMHDDVTLRKVIAHELIHHYQNVRIPEFSNRFSRPDGHGAVFIKEMNRINDIMGKDYVTPTSDQSYSVKQSEYYVLVQPRKGGDGLAWSAFVRPTPRIRDYVDMGRRDKKAKLFKSDYPLFIHGSTPSRGTSRVDNDKEANDLLKTMYDTWDEVSL